MADLSSAEFGFQDPNMGAVDKGQVPRHSETITDRNRLPGSEKFREAGGAKSSPEDLIREQMERSLYERSVEGALERIGSTTLPWEVRMAIRDEEFQFVDAPLGLGDNWGYQMLFNGIEKRRAGLKKSYGSEEAQRAVGFNVEPWRKTSVISRQNVTELKHYLLGNGATEADYESKANLYIKNAEKRVPDMVVELERSKNEVALIRKTFILGWTMKNAASGNEVGDTYLQAKLPALPRPKDFATIFSLPSYFMNFAEAGHVLDYPRGSDIETFLEEQKRSKENLPLGEVAEKEARLLRLVALSERPEKIVEWKHKTEQEALFEVFRSSGVNSAYLVLKEKGIDYRDPVEEDKIDRFLSALNTDANKDMQQGIKDAWWISLGFKNEADGIDKMGDPESWIPLLARRGEPPVGSPIFFDKKFDRQERIDKIKSELATLKKHWDNLSPFNNLTEAGKEVELKEIEASTNRLRGLQTMDDGKKLTSVFETLALEREIGLRKGPAEMGCIWNIPKSAGEKEKMMEHVFTETIGGDHLAYETAKIVDDMFGFQAKYSIRAVDYDPRFKDGSNGGWGSVGAEAWPYTNEFQNIMAYPWYAKYKLEAGGPEGSRGRFGPSMTDYLTSCVFEEKDDNGNILYIIIDENKQIRKGRADEGLIIADTSYTMMDVWEKGKSLSDPELWNDVLEDPFRRFLLRGFFAKGKAAIGAAGMIDVWKKREWKLEELDNDKFWDDYKLNRKVTIRDELYGEDVWSDVLASHNRNYKFEAGKIVKQVKDSRDPLSVIGKNAEMFSTWKGGRRKKIYEYSDQMFWNGVASTEGVGDWQLNEPGFLEKSRQARPSDVVTRIVLRARRCGVNLIGEYSNKNYVQGIMAPKI